MMSNNKFLLPVFACFIALGAPWSVVDADESVPTIAISSLILDDGRTAHLWTGDDLRGIEAKRYANLFIRNEGNAAAVSIPFGSPSEPFLYRGPRDVHFYLTPPPADPDEPNPEIIASVNLPEGAESVLLVFVTEDFQQQTFRILPIGLGSADSSAGSLRLINLTDKPLAWNVGEESGEIGARNVIVTAFPEGRSNSRLRLAQQDQDNGRWTVIYNRLLRLRGQQSYECLILPRPGTGGNDVIVRFVSDFPAIREQSIESGGAKLEGAVAGEAQSNN